MKKKKLSIAFCLFVITSAFSQWGHRYTAQQANQNITNVISTPFTVSVEWGEGDWTNSDFGYGITKDGTDWIWINLPWFENGTGTNKRCKTNITIHTPGVYYYAYRFTKNGATTYQHGSDSWSANATTLNAVSTITVSATKTWTGTTNSDWSTATNWSPSGIPSSTDNVYIPNGTNQPTATSAITVKNITIASGASFIAQNTVTGRVTYQRNLGTTNWYLVSSPVSGETIENFRSSYTLATGKENKLGLASYDNTQTSISKRWKYQSISSIGTMNNGQGFSVKLANAGSVSFSGTMNTTDISSPISIGAGNAFNLIGNPYTSFINSGTFLTTNAAKLMSQTLWVWNQATYSYETKVTVDRFKIAPGQGFFVQSSQINGNVTFTEASQSHQNTDTFRKQAVSRPEIHLFLKNDEAAIKRTKIYYISTATTGFDNGYDGELFGGVSNAFAIYSHLITDSLGKKYQIQSLPMSDYENMIIPIGVNAVSGKKITFSANSQNLPDGIKVFLEDKKTKAFTRLDQIGSKYTITVNNDLNGIGRFYLHTKPSVLNIKNIDLKTVNIYKTSNTNLRIVGLQIGNTTSINLFDILGKRVYTNSFYSNTVNDMKLPVLQNGIYIVQLSTTAGKLTKKIIIE